MTLNSSEVFLDDLANGIAEILLAKPLRREIVRAFPRGDMPGQSLRGKLKAVADTF